MQGPNGHAGEYSSRTDRHLANWPSVQVCKLWQAVEETPLWPFQRGCLKQKPKLGELLPSVPTTFWEEIQANCLFLWPCGTVCDAPEFLNLTENSGWGIGIGAGRDKRTVITRRFGLSFLKAVLQNGKISDVRRGRNGKQW